MATEELTCFLIAPFGDKKIEAEGAVGTFELLRSALKEIIESYPDIPIKFKRADEIVDVGAIGETFIPALLKADIVVADLSLTMNANVFYELGIRYSLRARGTIPIWQRGTKLPADLQGILGVEYEPTNPKANSAVFHQFIRQRLASQHSDSPVYKTIPSLAVVEADEINRLQHRVSELEEKLKRTRINDVVNTLWNEAKVLLTRDAPTAALEKLKIAFNDAPDNIELCLDYGKLLSKQNRHEEAVRILTKTVDLASESGGPRSVLHRELGMAYSRWKKPRLAVDWLEKAVADDPSDADTHGIIGGVYKQELEIEKAIEAYERGFDADETSTYCLLNIIALRMIRNETGDRLRVKRYLKQADQLTQASITTYGSDYWDAYDRGHYLLFAGKLNEAIDAFNEALSATKTSGELDSASKNLLLLQEFDVDVKGLDTVLDMIHGRSATLNK
ncbi:MAG: tetratricopeptide repeat protein [Synechococcus sp.]